MYLNCHTYYSLRFGTFSEIELLALAQKNDIKKLVLTDINNTSAYLNFVRKASDYNVQPVLGIDFRNGAKQQFVGIAKNNNGFQQLNAFLSQHLHEKMPFSDNAPELEDTYFIYPFSQLQFIEKTDFKPNEFIGISTNDLKRLPFSVLSKQTEKLVIMQSVSFRNKRDHNAHRLLRAIDNNCLLSMLPHEEQASLDEKMIPINELKAHFSEWPSAIKNTQQLLDECHVNFDFSKNRTPQNLKVYGNSIEEDEKLLDQLCEEGLPKRYENPDKDIKARLKKELDLIKKMGFVSYFLINWDIINYAKRQGYYYIGRGSGANSIVAYLLGITDVDPMELDLYFERFINTHRANPPDFDIDFSWHDRQDVTRYIFERFDHVALLGTYVTFKYRGVVRELGKVFGLPKSEIDMLSQGNYQYQQLDEMSKLVLKYGSLIQGMPNYVSIHAGGILISDKPLSYFSATNLPPKGFPTVQFDMIIAEDVGLFKFDILGQRGLAKIKEALKIIAYNQPEKSDFDIHDIKRFKKDKKINNLIKTAQCMACFYVESPAMRMLLAKLEVDNYLGLVAASSIIRPGVAKSGMMREYILRHRQPGRTEQYAHPKMLEIMPDTYGIMVYQEDVIKVAHYFAGLDLGEADVLRRGMSGKFRSREEFKRVEEKFMSNCHEIGYAQKLIDEIWHQISSFAGYAFAKGHSASYAVESYQTLFLKAYFPLEYLVATLNNGGGFYRPEMYIHEARMLGATIEPPCINNSFNENSITKTTIYLGFGYLKELEKRVIERILIDRSNSGHYKSLEDFIDRVTISIEQLSILIRVNAFRFTNTDKYELLWEAHLKIAPTKNIIDHPKLFPSHYKNYEIPSLTTTDLEAAFDQIELLEFPLCSPFLLLKEKLANENGAKDLSKFLNKFIDIYGYLVTVKNTNTHTGKQMHFATFIDQQGQVFDTVLFPPVARKHRFTGKGVYRCYGKVVSEFGFLSIEVIKMRKEAMIQDPRYADEKQEMTP
ncbi:DNA polymerase III subunit alpha [Spongiivirga sp. MCCC 1A20706]|uniref:DNA polymerase III subunit alpha n=1 Tax=Spongiivirga sp. MCCC 1A20706 TaxID=3160963 RepID=UPI0039772DDE